MTEVQLIPLDLSDREQFIRDNQEAFRYGGTSCYNMVYPKGGHVCACDI